MSDVTISPNMNLPVPLVGIEPGPDWANDINSCLGILDQHDHSNGSGVLITPDGININKDFPMNSNNITLAKSLNLIDVGTSLTAVRSVYVVAGELYYTDSAGNQVQVTKTGSVNATSSGISSGTASAAFAGGVLVVNAAALTPANIQVASVLLGNNIPSSNYLTLSPPNAMGSSYTVTLPPPDTSGGTVFMTYDTSGNMGLGPLTSGGITSSNISPSAGLNPPGAIIAYGGASAPTGWLLCDGSSQLRATYPDLFTAIGTAYGAADGTHFNLPQGQGMFLRGVGNATNNDPDKTLRVASATGGNTGNNIGSQQLSALWDHIHVFNVYQDNTNGINAGSTNSATITGAENTSSPQTATINPIQISEGESRPINIYVNYIIKT